MWLLVRMEMEWMENKILVHLESRVLLNLPTKDGHGSLFDAWSHGGAEAGVPLSLIRWSLAYCHPLHLRVELQVLDGPISPNKTPRGALPIEG
jgi:hypothetical protein